jgi:hypothetical protein
MNPMTTLDEFAELRAAATGVGPGKSLAAKVASAQGSQACGNLANACSTLRDFISEVAAQTTRTVPAATARLLAAEAQALQNALSCP